MDNMMEIEASEQQRRRLRYYLGEVLSIFTACIHQRELGFCNELYMCNRNLIDKEEKRESCCFLNVIGLIESRSNQWFAIKVLQSKVDFLIW